MARSLQRFVQPRLDRGGWVKMRHSYPSPTAMVRALRGPTGDASAPLTAETRIVLVGTGAAALTCAETLKQAGCSNVSIIAADALFGGKCVNLGCMPSEFVLANRHLPQEALRAGLADFIASLRGDAERALRSLGYPVLAARAAAVEGRELLLETGERLPFDRLVLATGSKYPMPKQIAADHPRLVGLEAFWDLPSGARLAIYADRNPAALSLGAVARALGLAPVVLMAGADGLGRLPAYRYFLRQLGNDGVEIRHKVRLLQVGGGQLTLEAGAKRENLAFDHLFVASRPSPRFIPIDGKTPTVFDLDHAVCTLPERPDITFLGDVSGLFTATEAEAQARLLTDSWLTGNPAGLERLASVPVTIDAPSCLAMLGPFWSLTSGDWREIDFRALGWSKVQSREGKLWYVFDEVTRRVQALHICHPAAKELIALASVLIERPVDDRSWHLGAPHPTGAEIFRLLARTVAGPRLAATTPVKAETMRVDLPALDELSPAGPLPEWLTAAQAAEVLTAADPRRAAAPLYAQAMLSRAPSPAGGPVTIRDDHAIRSCAAETPYLSVVVSY